MFLHYPIGPNIRPPARHITVVKDGAGVESSRRERYSCATCTEAAGERGSDLSADVPPLPNWPEGSFSPARHSTVVEDGAGVLISGRKRYCSATRTEAAGERGCGFVRCSTISQSTVTSRPQHDTAPLSRMAQVWYSPEESATAVRPVPRLLVSVGVVLSDVPPLPNWPGVSFSPARHITVVKDGAGVVTSGRERYCCATRTEAAGERGC